MAFAALRVLRRLFRVPGTLRFIENNDVFRWSVSCRYIFLQESMHVLKHAVGLMPLELPPSPVSIGGGPRQCFSKHSHQRHISRQKRGGLVIPECNIQSAQGLSSTWNPGNKHNAAA